MQKMIALSLSTLLLIAEETQLNDIVVSATKVSQSIEETTASVQVMTQEEITQRGYTSVVEALNGLAGVGFTQEGGLGGLTKLYVRGMGGARVLVLVNGVRFQDPSSKFGADFSRLLLSDVKRIELISGAQSGVWGADASAGVINIITTQPQEGWHQDVYGEFGSFNTKSVGISGNYKDERYQAKLSLSQYQTDGYSAQSPYGSDLDDYEDDDYLNRTVDLLLGYQWEDSSSITAELIDISTINNNDTYTLGENTANEDSEVETQSDLYRVVYDKQLNAHQLRVRYNRSAFEKHELDVTKGIEKYEGITDEVELHDTLSYRDQDYVLLGASYKADTIEIATVSSQESTYDIDSRAFFVTNTNVVDRWVVTESLREDLYSNFGNKVTGKVGVKYRLSPENSIKGNYGTAYNAPSLLMILNPNGKANPDLEAEDTRSFDVTLAHKNSSVTYFYNTVENLISYDKGENQHINIDGTSTFKGVEIKHGTSLGDAWYLDASYTYLWAKDKNGIDLRRRVKDTYKVALDYFISDLWRVNFNGEYLGERYDDMLSIKDPTKTKGRQTGKYFVGNMVVHYEVNDQLSSYLKVNNIFDRYYQVVDGYSTMPRAFYLGMRGRW